PHRRALRPARGERVQALRRTAGRSSRARRSHRRGVAGGRGGPSRLRPPHPPLRAAPGSAPPHPERLGARRPRARDSAGAAYDERGDLLDLGSNLSQSAVALGLRAGDPAAAAALAERGCRILEEAGERAWLSTGACYHAQALYELGRLDDAEDWARKGLDLGGNEDVTTQMFARQVQAKVLARRGQHAEGKRVAREAVALAAGTDGLIFQGDAP